MTALFHDTTWKKEALTTKDDMATESNGWSPYRHRVNYCRQLRIVLWAQLSLIGYVDEGFTLGSNYLGPNPFRHLAHSAVNTKFTKLIWHWYFNLCHPHIFCRPSILGIEIIFILLTSHWCLVREFRWNLRGIIFNYQRKYNSISTNNNNDNINK